MKVTRAIVIFFEMSSIFDVDTASVVRNGEGISS